MTTTASITAAFDRLDRHLETGLRADGRYDLDLLEALCPEVRPHGDISACPAWLPRWLGHLVRWIGSAISTSTYLAKDVTRSAQAAFGMARRASSVLREAMLRLDEEALRRLDYACRALALREGLRHEALRPSPSTIVPVVERFVGLCERAARGDQPSEEEWSAAVMAEAGGLGALRRALAGRAEAAHAAMVAMESAMALGGPKVCQASEDRLVTSILDAIEAA